jgi:glycyl-tRNA synthetase beta chain
LGVLSSTDVVDPSRFESASEQGLFEATQRLSPLASSGSYQDLCDALVESTPALEAFFDGDQSVMVMAEDPALRTNRLNLLAVLRNQAVVLAQFELIQS